MRGHGVRCGLGGAGRNRCLCDRQEARSLLSIAECVLLEEGYLLNGPLELQGGRCRDTGVTGVTLWYRGTA